MKIHYYILIITSLLSSCSKKSEKQVSNNKETKESKAVLQDIDTLTVDENEPKPNGNTIERFFPSEKETVEFDTTIVSENVSVTIISRHLDSFVVNEFETEEAKHIDKYRDSEKQIIIKKLNETLIDTVFRKGDFIDLTGSDFLEIADFHNYWFRELRNDTIEFFGVINKPETDWGTPFYHYFDLKSQTFTVKEYIEEDI